MTQINCFLHLNNKYSALLIREDVEENLKKNGLGQPSRNPEWVAGLINLRWQRGFT